MTVNKFFNNIRASNEQNLVENLVIESIKIKGMDVYYLPRSFVTKDTFFGEDPNSAFRSGRLIEMYLETVNGFEGDQDLLTKFGLEVRDSAVFVVAKVRFQKETDMLRPMEGDIIYLPMTKGFFEIKFVEHEAPFYQLGKNYTFKMRCELFQFSEESFETGETEIDTIGEAARYQITLQVTGGTGSLSVNDTVYQYANGSATGGVSGSDAQATVYSYNGNTVVLYNTIGKWKESTDILPLYITKNDNNYKIISDRIDSTETNTNADNKIIQDEADDKLDFTEDNIFGSY